MVAIDLADARFRRLARWLRTDAPRTYVEWLLVHPGTVLKEPLVRPERTYNNAEGHLSFYAATDRTDAPAFTTVLHPSWGWVLGAAVVAVAGGVLLGQARRLAWVVTAFLGVLGLFHMLVAWHGDGMEVTRHASVGNVQVRLAVVITLVMLLDGSRRTGARSASGLDDPEIAITAPVEDRRVARLGVGEQEEGVPE